MPRESVPVSLSDDVVVGGCSGVVVGVGVGAVAGDGCVVAIADVIDNAGGRVGGGG